MEGDGLGVLGEGQNGGSAVLYQAKAEGEDAEGVTMEETGRVEGSGEVSGLGGDSWEKEGEDDEWAV